MSRFLTELSVELKCGSDEISILKSPLIYESDLLGWIIVPTGFHSDGSSVPRLPMIYLLLGGRAHREGVIHDYLCRKDSKPKATFWQAARVFLEASTVRRKPFYIKYPMFIGICIGGRGAYHKHMVLDEL